MENLRMLIVEDETALLDLLKTKYREMFAAIGYTSITIEQAQSVADARRLAKAATTIPYDFVSLDVNLGDAAMTGLDVLASLGRFRSAWMVVLLTGVETDPSVDQIMGPAAGNRLRTQLRRDAYSRFPADRLFVLEKPVSSTTSDDARELLLNRLRQIVSVYKEVEKLRYIFRPIEVVNQERVKGTKTQKAVRKFIETATTHWQIRFDCGEIRTLPDKAGFRTLHRLLSLDPAETLTPEAALLAEPAAARQRTLPEGTDPVAAFFESRGIAWNDLDEKHRHQLVQAALAATFDDYQNLRSLQDDDDLSPNEEDELQGIIRELGPLADAAETAYERMKPVEDSQRRQAGLPADAMAQDGLHIGRGNYDRIGDDRRGKDSPEAALFRARMKRVKDCLRENGFGEFATHLDAYVQSTGANWGYYPPAGVEWTA